MNCEPRGENSYPTVKHCLVISLQGGVVTRRGVSWFVIKKPVMRGKIPTIKLGPAPRTAWKLMIEKCHFVRWNYARASFNGRTLRRSFSLLEDDHAFPDSGTPHSLESQADGLTSLGALDLGSLAMY